MSEDDITNDRMRGRRHAQVDYKVGLLTHIINVVEPLRSGR